MKRVLILLFAFVCLSACSNDQDNGRVHIRLYNNSPYDFENIVVNTSSNNKNYGNLGAGETSIYQEFELAYRYAFVELSIDGETFTIQPIDYVGETPLSAGNYTYQLDASDSQEQYGRLGITLIED